jgi:PEGA domain
MSRSSAKLAAAILAVLAMILPGCTYAEGRSTVLVTSTPAGAAILIDGVDTGETTPMLLDFSSFLNATDFFGSDRMVTIRKKGFEPETRLVNHHSSVYVSKWIDGATTFWFVTAPLFWTFGDFFLPFGARWDYVPHEVHVKLYPVGEAPGKLP